jgi:hypothetical protein
VHDLFFETAGAVIEAAAESGINRLLWLSSFRRIVRSRPRY